MIRYSEIMRNSALRVNALVGNTIDQKNASLTADPVSSAQVGSVEFPYITIKRAALAAAVRITRTYASVKNHPFRLFNLSYTANIANKATIPAVNAVGDEIIGVYGNILDVITSEPLTEQPKQIIDSINRSTADSSLKRSYFYYTIEGGRIYHTVNNVKIEVVTYNLVTEDAKIGQLADQSSTVPDACFDISWMAALTFLFADESYQNQAALCNNYVNTELAKMVNGATSFDPAPEFVLSANGVN